MEQEREKAHISQAMDCWRQQPVSYQLLSARTVPLPISVPGLRVSCSTVARAKPSVCTCRSSAASQPAPGLCGEARMQLPKAPLNCEPSDYNLICLHRVSIKLHHGHKHHRVPPRFPARQEVSLGVPRFTSTPAALPVWPGGFPKSKFAVDPAAGLTSVTRFWTPCPWHNADNPNSCKKGNQSTPELNCSTGVMLGDYDTNTRIKIPPGDTRPTLIQSKSAFQALYCLATLGRDPSVSFTWVFVCSLQTNVQKKIFLLLWKFRARRGNGIHTKKNPQKKPKQNKKKQQTEKTKE